jgi:hypothetical protein
VRGGGRFGIIAAGRTTMKSLIASTLIASALAGCAIEPASESTIESAEKFTGGFTGMVRRTLGLATGWSLLNYGCYCGLGNPDNVTWIDEVDNCCRIHDEKYLASATAAPGCSCRDVEYTYDIDATGKVKCDANQGACKDYCCAADAAFVTCTAGAGPLNPKVEKIDRANRCQPLECRADEDCDPGMYCDRGTCRMYCDPDGGSFAAATCDVTPLPTTTTTAL